MNFQFMVSFFLNADIFKMTS